eukprot:6430827-Amphidinium_carterae.1
MFTLKEFSGWEAENISRKTLVAVRNGFHNPLVFSVLLAPATACQELVKKLLTADLGKRYGNLKNGVADIKNHKWFKDVHWEQLLEKKLQVTDSLKLSSHTNQLNIVHAQLYVPQSKPKILPPPLPHKVSQNQR